MNLIDPAQRQGWKRGRRGFAPPRQMRHSGAPASTSSSSVRGDPRRADAAASTAAFAGAAAAATAASACRSAAVTVSVRGAHRHAGHGLPPPPVGDRCRGAAAAADATAVGLHATRGGGGRARHSGIGGEVRAAPEGSKAGARQRDASRRHHAGDGA